MAGPADRDIEYRRPDGRTGKLSPEDVEHISELSDGRGVIYTKRGEVVTIVRVAEFLRELRKRTGA